MTPKKRVLKRAIIVGLYVLVVAFIAMPVYFLLRTQPTCFDKKQNQGEEKIDCGGPCQKCEEMPVIENLEIVEKILLPASQGKYDALAKIKNPNSLFGVADLEYAFEILGADGKVIAQKSGSNFILPGETKYILDFNFEVSQEPAAFNFRIKSFRWQKFTDFEDPDISVYGKEFSFVTSGFGFAQLKVKIQNRSGYDFRRISAKAVLRDLSGNPVAVNLTNANDVKVNEEREIIFNWNEPFARDIDLQKIEIEPDVDVFDEDNFMKKYGSPDQYDSREEPQ